MLPTTSTNLGKKAMTTSPTYFVDYTSRWAVYVCVPVYIDMVEVASSNLAGPTIFLHAFF